MLSITMAGWRDSSSTLSLQRVMINLQATLSTSVAPVSYLSFLKIKFVCTASGLTASGNLLSKFKLSNPHHLIRHNMLLCFRLLPAQINLHLLGCISFHHFQVMIKANLLMCDNKVITCLLKNTITTRLCALVALLVYISIIWTNRLLGLSSSS